MKKLIFLFLLLFASFIYGQKVNLNVQIEGVKSEKGKIFYSLFSDKSGFPGDISKAVKSGMVKIENGHAIINMDLPTGTYALMVFHDEDDNNELNTNFIGIPKEGVGNSNDHKGFPNFKKSVFTLSKDKKIVINLWYS